MPMNIDQSRSSGSRTTRLLCAGVLAVLLGDLIALTSHDDGSSPVGSVAASEAVEAGQPAGGLPSTPGSPRGVGDGAGDVGAPPSKPITKPPRESRQSPGSTSATTVPAPSAGATTATTAPRPAYTYEVRLEPTCGRVGEDFVATFKVEPSSAVGAIASYADGDTEKSKASMWGTTAGDDGVVVHRWTAPAAPGRAKLLTGATTPDGRSGGTTLDFRVVGVTESC